MTVKLYVEGGGDTRVTKAECRRGFAEFFRRAGLDITNTRGIVDVYLRGAAVDREALSAAWVGGASD